MFIYKYTGELWSHACLYICRLTLFFYVFAYFCALVLHWVYAGARADMYICIYIFMYMYSLVYMYIFICMHVLLGILFVHLCLQAHVYTLTIAPPPPLLEHSASVSTRMESPSQSFKTASLSSCACVSRCFLVLAILPLGLLRRDSRSRLMKLIADLSFSFSWNCWLSIISGRRYRLVLYSLLRLRNFVVLSSKGGGDSFLRSLSPLVGKFSYSAELGRLACFSGTFRLDCL